MINKRGLIKVSGVLLLICLALVVSLFFINSSRVVIALPANVTNNSEVYEIYGCTTINETRNYVLNQSISNGANDCLLIRANENVYKVFMVYIDRMFPSDPSGSLDETIIYTLSPRCYPKGYAGFYILLGGVL